MELIPGSINCSKKKSITAYDIGPMSSHRDGGGVTERLQEQEEEISAGKQYLTDMIVLVLHI